MHTNVILTKDAHTQSNYTNTKLKAWFRRLLRHPARKQSGSILPAGLRLPLATHTSASDSATGWHCTL